MERSQSPNQIRTIYPDDLSIRKQLFENPQHFDITRATISRDNYSVIGNIKIGIRSWQSSPKYKNMALHGKLLHPRLLLTCNIGGKMGNSFPSCNPIQIRKQEFIHWPDMYSVPISQDIFRAFTGEDIAFLETQLLHR